MSSSLQPQNGRMVLSMISTISIMILATSTFVHGFTPSSSSLILSVHNTRRTTLPIVGSFTTIALWNTVDNDTDKVSTTETSSSSTTEGAFVPLSDNSEEEDDEEEDDDDVLEKVEMFGKGAAKVKRGKRKGSAGSSSSNKTPVVKAALVPEEVYYEGPPALSETFLPTLSILTVVGIIPAAASWARQAWVRYKITSRRIRVNSGIGGNDMSEIIYPDIIEIRTVKRLFGDGDMVCYLRDGAKFEMRNIPNFDTAIEFILKQCNDDVVQQYRNKGDVGRG